jgi:hypothetical protein
MSQDNSDSYSQLWNQATFMPHDLSTRSDMLREAVAKRLQTNFLAFSLFVSAMQPDLYIQSGLAEHCSRFQSFDSEKKRRFVEYPLFRIWLKQATRSMESGVEVESSLMELKRVIEVFEKNEQLLTVETECGTVELLRFNPDALIRKAVQQDYSFPDASRREEFEQAAAYPVSLFVESIDAALGKIRFTWFEAFRDFFKFVKIVVDLIDARFKSYSSQELTGVILVSTNNGSLLLEEYLVHEFGHQILDNLMELDPLVVKEETRQTFSLPWSGKETEIYGYLHAFFVYILLYNYYERVKVRSLEEEGKATERLAYIGDGLLRALAELEHAELFTPRGKELFENLTSEMHRLGLN